MGKKISLGPELCLLEGGVTWVKCNSSSDPLQSIPVGVVELFLWKPGLNKSPLICG